jgi:hypothetical protein
MGERTELGNKNYKMKLLFKTCSASKGTIRIHIASVLFTCVLFILIISHFISAIAKELDKDTSSKQAEQIELKKDSSSINKTSDNKPENVSEKQIEKQSIEKTEKKTEQQQKNLFIRKEGIRTGSETIPKKTVIIKTPGNNAGIQEKAEIKKPAWETDEAFFCTVYGTVAIDFPVDYFSKLYSSSVGAEVTVIGEKWSKWGIHPTLYYRMFRLQSLGKQTQVATVFEGHGFGIGVEYSYGINLPAINRKLYLHAGFFNGLMIMAMFSDNYKLPIYDATYSFGATAGISIRVWEYLMARVSFEYMPVFTTGTTVQFVAVTVSLGFRI